MLNQNSSKVLLFNYTATFMSVWNDSIKLCSSGGQPIIRRILKSSFLLTKSMALVRSMKLMFSSIYCFLSSSPGAVVGRRLCLPLISLNERCICSCYSCFSLLCSYKGGNLSILSTPHILRHAPFFSNTDIKLLHT